jgi:hypothetical protein
MDHITAPLQGSVTTSEPSTSTAIPSSIPQRGFQDGPFYYIGQNATYYDSLAPFSNTYYQAYRDATGVVEMALTLPEDTNVTVVVK